MIFLFYIFWHYKTPPYDFMMRTIVLSCSVVSPSLQPYGLQSARLLCPGDSRQEYWKEYQEWEEYHSLL